MVRAANSLMYTFAGEWCPVGEIDNKIYIKLNVYL
eukprot:SAG31_NODE_4103_length_3579_cov_2.836494_3_plen_35_part_00